MKASDVIVRRRTQVLTGDKIEVECDGEVLAWCFIGDDLNVEIIADMLSVKGARAAAGQMRQIAQDARRPKRKPVGLIERAKAMLNV